ncbi:thioredoxin-2 [Stomoxys calcitrans]|uniref:thioredoxin-2 n=1 Tax=Stomoxys calcitrans TaxID=35570 RepID=UPI0027E27910|nr:thioredoxin-2 [Stomoxys calcitrans]
MIYQIHSKEQLDNYVANAGDKLVVVDFFAAWCEHCKIIAPRLEELSSLYCGEALMLKVDVDECEDIAVDYNVVVMPTFVFIKNKIILDVCVGGHAEKLTKHFEKYIANANSP